MEWVKPRSFDAFANGVLVHPDLGKPFAIFTPKVHRTEKPWYQRLMTYLMSKFGE